MLNEDSFGFAFVFAASPLTFALAIAVEILLRRSAAEPQKIATESAAAGNAQIKI